jgi:hypothetical protein
MQEQNRQKGILMPLSRVDIEMWMKMLYLQE